MSDRSKLFFAISLALSYYILTDGTLEFSWLLVFFVPIFALWLSVPIFMSRNEDSGSAIVGYLFWVAIQWAIYYYGLGPPEGVGVPHFY